MLLLRPVAVAAPPRNCSAGHVSSSCVPFADRNASLHCLLAANITPAHDPVWSEWDPNFPCKTVDGYKITLGQPKNAISSFAFDEIACRRKSPNLRPSAAFLSFASFAFHAKGAAEWTHSLDGVGMSCLAVNMLFEANARSHSSQLVHNLPDNRHAGNFSFNLTELRTSCVAEMSEGLRACDQDGLHTLVRRLKNSIPSAYLVWMALGAGASRYCYGDNATSAVTKLFEILLHKHGAHGLNYTAAMGYTFSSPRPIREPQDYLPPGGFCWNFDRFAEKFAEASLWQGDLPGSILPQEHDKWHRLSAEAIGYGMEAIETW